MKSCLDTYKSCYPECLETIDKLVKAVNDHIDKGNGGDQKSSSNITISSSNISTSNNTKTIEVPSSKNCLEELINKISSGKSNASPKAIVEDFIKCIDKLLEIIEERIESLYKTEEEILDFLNNPENQSWKKIERDKFFRFYNKLKTLPPQPSTDEDTKRNSFPYLFLEFQAEPKVFWNLMHNLSANLLYTTKSLFCLQSLIISLIPCMVAKLSSKDKLKYQEELNRRVHLISTLINRITREFGFSTARGCDLINSSNLINSVSVSRFNYYCFISSLFENSKQTLRFAEHLVSHCGRDAPIDFLKKAISDAQDPKNNGKRLVI